MKILQFTFTTILAGAAMLASVLSCRKEEVLIPSITLDKTSVNVSADGGSYTAVYRMENSERLPEAVPSADWISDVTVVDDISFTFKIEANPGTESRTAGITLSLPGAEDCVLTVVQEGSEGGSEHPEEDLKVEVNNITSFTADVRITPASDTLTYVVLTGEKSEIDSYANDADLIEYNLGVFEETADYYGVSLEYFLENSLLHCGETVGTMTTFEPEHDYYIYAYGLTKQAQVTTDVVKTPFATPPVKQYDTSIDFVVDRTGTREIQLTVKPESYEYRYLAGYFTEAEFETVAADFIPFMIQETQMVINMNTQLGNPMTWETVTTCGDSTINAAGLTSGSTYVFWAFGVENGYSNTELFSKTVTTNTVQVTDDCGFDAEILKEDTYGVNFKVTPTSPDTRYVVMLVEATDIIGLENSAIADACINSLNSQGIDWTNDSQIRQGEITDTYTGLTPLTTYDLVIFGVNSEGERTTEVVLEPFTTTEVPQSDMTFEINVTETAYSYVTLSITPSVKDEEYMYGLIPLELYQSLGSDPNTVRDQLIAHQSDYAFSSTTGDMEQSLRTDMQYNFIKPGETYIAFAFGCSYWHPTTDMYTLKCSTPERTVSDARVDIILTVFDGNDMVAYDPAAYPAETYKDNAVVLIQFQPNSETATWYGWTETRSADYMNGLNYDILLGAIKSNGTFFNSPTAGSSSGVIPWDYQNYSVLSLGVDENGVDGEPVIKSLCISRDQAVEFDPSVLGTPVAVPFRAAN